MAQRPRKRPGRSPKANRKKSKPKYRVRNWSAYNEALIQRGEMLIWVDPEIAERWYLIVPEKTDPRAGRPRKKRGRPQHYSDLAISTVLELGALCHQALRQSQGLMRVLFRLVKLELLVPNFSTLCRRMTTLALSLPGRHLSEPVHVIVDATGLKVFGEGEWKVRKYGFSRHRTWRKLHLALTPQGEIRAVAVSGNDTSDGEMVEPLLAGEEAEIAGFIGDGAYDKRPVYQTLSARQTVREISIPPQKNARIWRHGNSHEPRLARDENLRAIRASSRRQWKEDTGYHRRSMAENVFFRYKRIFGDQLQAHRLDHQATEVRLRAGLLNRMRELGMPVSYRVA